MTTDQGRPAAELGPAADEPAGEQPQTVEQIAELVRAELTCAQQARAQADTHRGKATAAAGRLVERLGRPGAARLLGLSGRELASLLPRGSK